MQNQSTSARTAAKKSFKCSLLFRQPCILAMLFLCAVLSTEAQTLPSNTLGLTGSGTITTMDTIEVVLLISDTTTNFYTTKYINVAPVVITGYSVKKKQCCIDSYSGNLSLYKLESYYTHLEYLDSKKMPLSKSIIVWQIVYK